MRRAQTGFTLLELLIAIALFALLGLGTYRMLQAVLASDAAVVAQEQALRELTRGLGALERDLLQVAPRPVRDEYGDELGALVGQVDARDDMARLEFTRGGWRNPTGLPRAGLQRVRWQLDGDRLQRLYWVVLDRDVATRPRTQTVLDGVRGLTLRYQDRDGVWHATWPPLEQGRGDPLALSARLPGAVEVTLDHVRHGRLVRLLRLPDATGGTPLERIYEGVPEGVHP